MIQNQRCEVGRWDETGSCMLVRALRTEGSSVPTIRIIIALKLLKTKTDER